MLLKDGKCAAARKPIDAKTAKKLAGYQQNLQSTRPMMEWFDLSGGLAVEAEHLLPADLLEAGLRATSLVIVPHGPLHLIPWAGLAFRGKRLFEYCPVGVLPNLSCLASLQADFSAAPQIAIFGAPDYRALPKVRPLVKAVVELETIADIYKQQGGVIGKAMTGADATEANFWLLAKHKHADGNIFHIASHGDFVADEPMNSGLLFADGKVDAAALARARLQYREVVLSACSTGYRPTEVQGVQLASDDILGLPGALLEGGAHLVLASIPLANDAATYQLMTYYHENRSAGEKPLASFQEAQKAMLQDAKYPPYLWAGFTLYGCQ